MPSKIASIERQCSRITAQKTHRLRLGRTQKLADERLRFQHKRTGRRSGFPLLCEQHGAIRSADLVQSELKAFGKIGRAHAIALIPPSRKAHKRHSLLQRNARCGLGIEGIARQHLHLHVCDKPVFFP